MIRKRRDHIRWIPVPEAAPEAGVAFAPEAAPAAVEAIVQAIQEVGIPKAPPPHDASPLLEARYLLTRAAEIEHGLLIQYLYAAYSIDGSLSGPREWASDIIDIAIQEMFHLLSVQNLLLAVGADLYFDRENYPVQPGPDSIYPFPFALEPLTTCSLAKYVVAESPVDLPPPGDPLRAKLEEIRAEANCSALMTINHVGLIYAKLYWLFMPDDESVGIWADFPVEAFRSAQPGWHLKPGDYKAENLSEDVQPDPNDEGWEADPDNGRIAHRVLNAPGDALAAIHQIAIQGEGVAGRHAPNAPAAELSHFDRFLKAFDELKGFSDPAGRKPVLDVPKNPHTGDVPQDAATADDGRITHPTSLLWARLFNARYQILLHKLALAMGQKVSEDDGSNAGRASLIEDAIGDEMRNFIRRIAAKLVKSPRLAGQTDVETGPRAAPPFELPIEALPEGRADRLVYLKGLIDTSLGLIEQILDPAGGHQTTAPETSLLKAIRKNDTELKAAIPSA